MKFTYIGGKQPTEGVHTDVNGNVTRNEASDPTDAPDECFAFGITFQRGVPLDVTRDRFTTAEHFQNALRRLEQNRFFARFAEDAAFEEVAAPAPTKKGRKAAPVEAPPADEPVAE
jgi:hypothetical protein